MPKCFVTIKRPPPVFFGTSIYIYMYACMYMYIYIYHAFNPIFLLDLQLSKFL